MSVSIRRTRRYESNSGVWANSPLPHNSKMADLLLITPQLEVRSRRRENLPHATYIPGWSKGDLFTRHRMDDSRAQQLHPDTISLAGIGHLHPEIYLFTITLASTTGLGHLDPEFGHLVIILVGTAGPTRLHPGIDHLGIVMTLEITSPWTSSVSFRAR